MHHLIRKLLGEQNIIISFDWWKTKLETFIDGKIVKATTEPLTRIPKKGPTINGHEYIFVIEK